MDTPDIRGIVLLHHIKMSPDNYLKDLADLHALERDAQVLKGRDPSLWRTMARIRELKASIDRFEAKHSKKPDDFVLCALCWEHHKVAKSIQFQDTYEMPGEWKKGVLAARICSSCLYDLDPPHECDYAGYGGACSECGELRCGCIDLCRGRCGTRRWSRW